MEIEFDDVSYEYSNGAFVLSNLSFKILNDKITVIVGERGSGKSSLLSLMSGNLKPQMGEVYLFEKIGFLCQNSEERFFCNSVYEELLFNLKKHKYKGDINKRIINVLKMVGFDQSYLSRSPFLISKGEQKKLALASILVYNPKVLILDEPFMGLDYESKINFIKLIKMIKFKYGKTIIMATNDIDMAFELADNIIALESGKLVFEGNKFDLFTNYEMLERCHICQPKIIEFSDMVKKEKNIDMGYRDNLEDMMKDIYRFTE